MTFTIPSQSPEALARHAIAMRMTLDGGVPLTKRLSTHDRACHSVAVAMMVAGGFPTMFDGVLPGLKRVSVNDHSVRNPIDVLAWHLDQSASVVEVKVTRDVRELCTGIGQVILAEQQLRARYRKDLVVRRYLAVPRPQAGERMPIDFALACHESRITLLPVIDPAEIADQAGLEKDSFLIAFGKALNDAAPH